MFFVGTVANTGFVTLSSQDLADNKLHVLTNDLPQQQSQSTPLFVARSSGAMSLTEHLAYAEASKSIARDWYRLQGTTGHMTFLFCAQPTYAFPLMPVRSPLKKLIDVIIKEDDKNTTDKLNMLSSAISWTAAITKYLETHDTLVAASDGFSCNVMLLGWFAALHEKGFRMCLRLLVYKVEVLKTRLPEWREAGEASGFVKEWSTRYGTVWLAFHSSLLVEMATREKSRHFRARLARDIVQASRREACPVSSSSVDMQSTQWSSRSCSERMCQIISRDGRRAETVCSINRHSRV